MVCCTLKRVILAAAGLKENVNKNKDFPKNPLYFVKPLFLKYHNWHELNKYEFNSVRNNHLNAVFSLKNDLICIYFAVILTYMLQHKTFIDTSMISESWGSYMCFWFMGNKRKLYALYNCLYCALSFINLNYSLRLLYITVNNSIYLKLTY